MYQVCQKDKKKRGKIDKKEYIQIKSNFEIIKYRYIKNPNDTETG